MYSITNSDAYVHEITYTEITASIYASNIRNTFLKKNQNYCAFVREV